MLCFIHAFVKHLFLIHITSFLHVFDELCTNEIRYFICIWLRITPQHIIFIFHIQFKVKNDSL